MSLPRGWFADIDPEANPHYQYQPCLQLDGRCHSFDVWFATEEECLSYIAVEIIGQGFIDTPTSGDVGLARSRTLPYI